MFWKVKLLGRAAIGNVEYRKCCEADTMDEAIELVKVDICFDVVSSQAQAFSDLEAMYPEAAQVIFLESGSFHHNFKVVGK
jgi:hypothetical protein